MSTDLFILLSNSYLYRKVFILNFIVSETALLMVKNRAMPTEHVALWTGKVMFAFSSFFKEQTLGACFSSSVPECSFYNTFYLLWLFFGCLPPFR